jgi:transposase
MAGTCTVSSIRSRASATSAMMRKGSFGSDSEAGSRFAERLLSVAAICRQQGRSLLDFLIAASAATLRGITAPSLLPTRSG